MSTTSLTFQLAINHLQRLIESLTEDNNEERLEKEIKALLKTDEKSAGYLPEDFWNGGEALEEILYWHLKNKKEHAAILEAIINILDNHISPDSCINCGIIIENLQYLSRNRVPKFSEKLREVLEQRNLLDTGISKEGRMIYQITPPTPL